MNIVISGGRNFPEGLRPMLYATMDRITARLEKVVLYTGGAKGVDRMGQDWALSRGHTVRNYYPDWDRLGKAAGPVRNQEMLDDGAQGAVIFWDGESRGTGDMLARVRRAGLKYELIYFEPEES